jgi:hypothetical protein
MIPLNVIFVSTRFPNSKFCTPIQKKLSLAYYHLWF